MPRLTGLFLLCFTLYSRANSKYKPPQGAYIRRSDLTEGFCVIILGGLYFGGAEQICTLEYSQETFSREKDRNFKGFLLITFFVYYKNLISLLFSPV